MLHTFHWSRAITLGVGFLALTGVAPAGAAAQGLEPVVQQNIPAIAEHLARGGATDVPGVTCGTTCSTLWQQEHAPIPNQPSSQTLHRELRNARSSRLKVLPRMR